MTDYKGGYQIVEIGTGVEGMYKKLESAYNSGKPILVKKGGKVSFGNVTKDGNYFVANYIIDDTLYQDTISQLDAITDSSIDIGDSSGEISAIEERLNKNVVETTIDLSTYDSSSNPYTIPDDGYIRVVTNSNATTGRVSVAMHTQTNSYVTVFERDADNKSLISSMFVRKGSKVYVSNTIPTGYYSVIFMPLI